MTTTQHTPWTMRLHLNTAEDEAFAREHGVKMTLIPALTADGSRIISGPDGHHVAYVPPVTEPKRGEGYKHVDEERDARGHLIAAAPELLAACRAAEPEVETRWKSLYDEGHEEVAADLLKVLEYIRAAIAKAENGEKA